jgi:uncharacterized protein GlcG (DUF336 family)
MSDTPTTLIRASVSAHLAGVVASGAIAHAEQLGKGFTIAVVDESGVLKLVHRMDGAPLISVQIAQDKAYTAAGFGIPSHAWHDFIKDDPPLAVGAPTAIDRLVVFGGGFPLLVDGQLVGAVGVSGGHYTEDMDVATAGLRAAGLHGGAS